MKNIFGFISKLFLKGVQIGGINTSVGTIATVAVVTTVAIGGTTVAVTNHVFEAKSENAVVEEISNLDEIDEIVNSDEEIPIQNNVETKDVINNEDSSTVSYKDENGNTIDINVEDIHTHNLLTQVVEEPTCSTTGLAYEYCPECGYTSDTYTLPVNNNHSLEDWVVVTEATEVSDGLKTRSCSVCGNVIETEVIPIIPHNHNYVVSVTESASCEKEGYNIYSCSICGSSYTETIEATGHNYNKEFVEEASCTSPGHIYQKCSTCGKTIEVGTISAKGHNYGEWKAVTEANCTEAGEETKSCSVCGYTENRTIPAKGHTESEVITTKEATCTEEGAYTYTCSVCDTVVENNVIAPLGHNYGEPDVVDSTCSTEGNKKYTCQREGCDYSYEEVIAKKDHTESDWIDNSKYDKVPTCTKDGLKHTECTECHAIMQTEVIPATGHTWGEWEETKAPECEKVGEETRTCSVCHEPETRDIPATGHNYEVLIDTPATCEQNGTKHKECSYCNDKKDSETIPAIGHSFVKYEVVTPATDLAEGLERATCENGCGKTDERVIAKLPHTHDYNTEKTRVEATCTEDGYYILECRCGSTMEVDIPKTGHDYQEINHVDANCILEGSDTYKCSKCDDTYDIVIPATGHTAGDWEISKPATDLEEGQKVRKCTSCGTILDTQTISKLPHTCEYNMLIESQEATCTTDGYELYECRCGLKDKVTLPKTNHTNAEWQTTKEATYTEMGLKEKICPDCHATLETENIPVKPHEHNYEVTSSTDATCTESGTTVKTCSICGNTTTIVTPANGHVESEFYVDTNATCTSTGTKHTECSVCHITLTTETIPATGHTEGEWKTDSDATCTDNGYRHTECIHCGTTLTTETIPATGHFIGDWHETASASCENEGTEERNCSNCSYSESRSIPALGHDYGDWIVDEEATEEEEGSRHKECSRCDSTITEDIEKLPPHVHNYSETSRTESTCSNVGSITYTCDGCGNFYSEEIAKKEHTPGEWTVKTPATEDSTGLEERTCTECGTQTDSRVIDKLPHTHNYTTESKSVTCTEDGYEKQTCACGSVINTVIPATGHTYGEAVVVDPTCTKKGSSTISCEHCSHTEVTDIPATGHNYVESEKTAATCEETGSVTYKCTNCEDTYSEPIEKLEHEYAVTSTIEATCTKGGYTIETCKHCGDTKRTNETVATGHDDGEWTIVKEAELGVAGSKELRCTKCNTLLDTEEIPMLTTDGTDSVYYFENADGNQEMVIGHYNETEAQEMLTLVNNYREENGLDTFTVPTTYMNSYTALRAVETSYLWDHSRPSGAGCEYAENIAMSTSDGKGNTASVQAIFDAWVASAGHKNNLDAIRTKNWTCISVFYKRCPVYNSSGEVSRYAYEAYWVETFK